MVSRQLSLFSAPSGELVQKTKVKALQEHMARNWFALSKRDTRDSIQHKWANGYVKVTTSGKSLATIYDNDVLLYIVSNIRARISAGETGGLIRSHEFSVYDFLIFKDERLRGKKQRKNPGDVGKKTSGALYKSVWEGLARLQSMNIETSVKAAGYTFVNKFVLIPSIAKVESNGRVIGLRVELSEWLANKVTEDEALLTLFDDRYFRITSGLARWLYLWARKSCGRQKQWKEKIESVWMKSASGGSLKKFKQLIRGICKNGLLDEYSIAIEGDYLIVRRTAAKLIRSQ